MRIFREEQLTQIMPLIDAMQEIGSAHGGRSPAQVALNWVARKSNVFAIPGAKNPGQAQDNAAALNWTMSDDEAARLDDLSKAFR